MDWEGLINRPMYYDRSGVPISSQQMMELKFIDPDYGRVMRSTVVDAAHLERTYDVSTVWLGLDQGFGSGPPVIFETMIFALDDDDEWQNWCDRYCTEVAARDGHTEAVVQLCADLTDPVVMEAEDYRVDDPRPRPSK